MPNPAHLIPRVGRHRRSGFGGAATCVLLAAACLAPRPGGEEGGHEGSAEEFGHLLSDGARPVVAQETDGVSLSTPQDDLPSPEELAPLLEEQSSEPADEEEEIDPYLRFGERIVVQDREDGVRFVTKLYTLPPGKAQRIVQLVDALEPFPFGARPAPQATGPPPAPESADAAAAPAPEVQQRPPHDPSVVYYEILKDWDAESYTNLTAPETATPGTVVLGDGLAVTAVPGLLSRFESFVDLFGQVPQIELEAKIIEISEVDSTDIGVKSPGDVPIFEFGSNTFVRALDFNLANSVDPTEALLTLGAVQGSVTFNAIIEAVKSWQNISIQSQPKTVVRAGGVAHMQSTQRVPVLEVKSISDTGSFSTSNTYIETGVKLYISPRVVGSKTLSLDVQLEGSQTIGFQSTFAPAVGNAILAPIIATRSAKSLVYLEPGQTLLIGGLTQESTTTTESKVPILGDIPLLGLFFRNHRNVIERQHVIFAISPRIVQRGDLEGDF